ncbi:hypothetical protein [Marmoricola endophyticus]|uniref:hypothetical protein n=1 Tax=Marmoricola endophyticus TaxID=2040280 RepID=UPI0016637B29|nr:hypothetical protein [Marmoricola endophyticus]
MLTRALLSGLAGTAAMTATTTLERRLRPRLDHPVDYDASTHVATAVGAVLRRPARGEAQRRGYFLLAHWGYGSAVAVGYDLLRTRLPATAAVPTFYAGCQAMAWTLFPTVGGAPPPWRWRRDVVVSSLAQHAVYVAVVAGVARAARLDA